jgi:hypothetical protein
VSGKDDRLDGAPMESFFHSLEVERVHTRRYATRLDARRDPFACIEGLHKPGRLRSALRHITPCDAETKAARPCPLLGAVQAKRLDIAFRLDREGGPDMIVSPRNPQGFMCIFEGTIGQVQTARHG